MINQKKERTANTLISIFILLLMAAVITFFVPIQQMNFTKGSLIYALFLIYLFAKMTFAEQKKKGSGVKYRRIFQSTFAILFCISFIKDLYAERGSMAITDSAMSNAELPFCHIVIPQILLPLAITKNIIFPARLTGHYAAVANMLVIWLTMSITIGRGWCGWVCFYGGWEEGMTHVAKKRRLNIISKNKEIREFQFGFFAFIILVSLGTLSAAYCEWFCPFKLVTEFSPITSIPTLISAIIFIGLFLALVIIFPILTKKRTQCSTLCPFGALASITDRFSMFRMKIDTSKCKRCMKCVNTCPFGALDEKTILDKKGTPELTCAKCGECVNICEEKAISYDFRFMHICEKPEAKNAFEKSIHKLLDPALIFRFASFSFGVIMSGSFATKSIDLILEEIFRNFGF